ncbi:MAG: YkgJ family cysteine cluster protein [Bacteroidales bacterium]
MDAREINRIFYRDGYQLAHSHLQEGFTAENLMAAIGQLYDAVDGLLEVFLNRTTLEGKPAECKKGCSWCCHQAVFAVTHEILYILAQLMEGKEEEKQLRFLNRANEKSKITTRKSYEELLRFRKPCPFLTEGICGIYDVRPMACRIYLSSSEPACQRDYRDPGDEQNFPELFEFPLRAGRMLNEGFVAYLKQNGLQVSELPIEQGISHMAGTGMTLDKWIDRRNHSL